MLYADVLGERGPVRAPIAAKTGLDGLAELDLFPGYRYRFRIERGTHVVRRVEIAASADPIVITLPLP